jgi:phage gp36-like protein
VSVTVYAAVPDFIAVLPQTAWGPKTTVDVQTALADMSGLMDDHFRGVYPLPFLAVGRSVTRLCALGARYLFLGGRGFSPVTDSDRAIVADFAEVMARLDKYQRRVLFPDVTIDPNATLTLPQQHGAMSQPTVSSLPPRGWHENGGRFVGIVN